MRVTRFYCFAGHAVLWHNKKASLILFAKIAVLLIILYFLSDIPTIRLFCFGTYPL